MFTVVWVQTFESANSIELTHSSFPTAVGNNQSNEHHAGTNDEPVSIIGRTNAGHEGSSCSDCLLCYSVPPFQVFIHSLTQQRLHSTPLCSNQDNLTHPTPMKTPVSHLHTARWFFVVPMQDSPAFIVWISRCRLDSPSSPILLENDFTFCTWPRNFGQSSRLFIQWWLWKGDYELYLLSCVLQLGLPPVCYILNISQQHSLDLLCYSFFIPWQNQYVVNATPECPVTWIWHWHLKIISVKARQSDTVSYLCEHVFKWLSILTVHAVPADDGWHWFV